MLCLSWEKICHCQGKTPLSRSTLCHRRGKCAIVREKHAVAKEKTMASHVSPPQSESRGNAVGAARYAIVVENVPLLRKKLWLGENMPLLRKNAMGPRVMPLSRKNAVELQHVMPLLRKKLWHRKNVSPRKEDVSPRKEK
jgi:hypothetical protein